MLHFRKKQIWDSIQTGDLLQREDIKDGFIRESIIDKFIVRGGGDGFPTANVESVGDTAM